MTWAKSNRELSEPPHADDQNQEIQFASWKERRSGKYLLYAAIFSTHTHTHTHTQEKRQGYESALRMSAAITTATVTDSHTCTHMYTHTHTHTANTVTCFLISADTPLITPKATHGWRKVVIYISGKARVRMCVWEWHYPRSTFTPPVWNVVWEQHLKIATTNETFKI